MTSSFLPPQGTDFGSFGDYSGLGGTPAVNFQGTFDTPSTFNAPNLGIAESIGGGLVGNIFQGQSPVGGVVGQAVQSSEIASKEPGFLDYIRAIGPLAAGASDVINALRGNPTRNYARFAGQRLGGYYDSTNSRGATESKDDMIRRLSERVRQLEEATQAPRDVSVTGGATEQPEQADAGDVQRKVAKPLFSIPGISADAPVGAFSSGPQFQTGVPDLSDLNIPRI
jgi:hypothetical protein